MAIRGPRTDVPEVRCDRCRVSFPPEVRRCVHCGERTHAPGDGPSLLMGGERPLREIEPFVVGETPRSVPRDRGAIPSKDEEDELESAARSPLRMISALVWILLALAGGMYRACTG